MPARASRLVLGIGHMLRHDDGVGVHAAEILRARSLPEDVEVIDAGLAGWELSSVIERRDLVIVIDAIDAGAEPGALFRLAPDDLRPAVVSGMSLHDFHLLDALEETRLLGTAPREVVIYGIQPQDLSSGIGLTPAVEEGMRAALLRVLDEFGLSQSPQARRSDEPVI